MKRNPNAAPCRWVDLLDSLQKRAHVDVRQASVCVFVLLVGPPVAGHGADSAAAGRGQRKSRTLSNGDEAEKEENALGARSKTPV